MGKRKGFKKLAIILILVLLSNITFVSTGYAADLSVNPANDLKPLNIGPSNGPNVASGVYLEQPNPARIHKEIEFPAIPNTPFAPNNKGTKPGGVFMKYVSHMPKVDEKPVPYTPKTDRIPIIQNPVINETNNNPGITNSVHGKISASPDALVFSNFSETVFDEDDLNLVSDDAAEGSLQNVINYIDSINNNVSGSVYHSITNSIYNDATDTENKLPSNPTDAKQNNIVSSIYTVSVSANNSFPIHNKAGKFSAGFSRQAGSNLLRFSFKNANIALGPLNSAAVSGTVDKNRILYEEVYPSTDIRYTVEQSRLKEELIVKKYTGQSDFFFNIGVQEAVYKVSSDSTIVFYDPASEQPLFYIPKGFAVDSSGNRTDSVSLEFTEEGLLKLSVDSNWLKNAAYPVIIDPTISLFDANFSRPSVAYKQDGTQVANDSPRYEAAKFNQGIMVEEGTTNFLTANQSSIETDTTGFAGWGATLNRDTSVYRQGTAGLKVVTSANGNLWDGVYTDTTVTPSRTYTFSVYVKNQIAGIPMFINIMANVSGQLGNVSWTSTTEWTRYTTTVTLGASDTSVSVRVSKAGYSPAVTFWVDGLQLEQKAYATSWQIGGTTRSPETITIPTAGIFTKGNWTVETNYIPLDNPASGGFESLWNLPIDSNNGYSLVIHPNGKLYLAVKSNGTEVNTFSASNSPTLTVGTPYAIMASGNGSVMRLYVNGVQIGPDFPYTEPVGTLPALMYVGSFSWGAQSNGIIDDLRISNRARTLAEHQTAYQSNQPLPVDRSTTCKLSFDGTLHAYPTINTVNAQFSRLSVAYKQDGTQVASGAPRYEAGKFNQGIMIEEGTTNLLANSDCETAIPTLNGSYTSQMGTAELSSNFVFSGAKSLHLANPNNPWGGAFRVGTWNLNGLTVGQKYTFSCWVYVPNNANNAGLTLDKIALHMYDAMATPISASPTKFDTWQKLTITHTVGLNGATVFMPSIAIGTTVATHEIYVDCLQLEQKPYATSWQIGGTTRSAETLTIPTAGIFTKGNWTVETNYIPLDNPASGGFESLWNLPIDSNNSYSLVIHPNGRLYLAVRSNGTEVNTYSASNTPTLSAGTPYAIMASGNGSVMRLYVNGVQIGPDFPYTEPVGTLPALMYVGSFSWGGQQANGIIDDLRISNRARTLAEHQAAYQSNQPLPMDAFTTCKLSFDNSSSGYSTASFGPGIEPYWNYTSTSLGGGWQASVNTWNLNLILSKPLFLIPGRGMPIGESITYNSIQGKNWTFGNQTSLVENPDGSVTYNKSDGGAYTFTPNGSGGYIAPLGVYLTLQKNGAGNFTVLDKHKNTYNYVNGKPNQFKDRNNNTTTFNYDPNTGRLNWVSDPSGRRLTYAYSADGSVSSVTDPANRAYQFGYQNGNLTSVTDPDNKTFTLSCDANGRIATFTDPLNRVTSFFGNPNGQIMRLRDARTNGQDVYETSFTQILEGSGIIAKVTDPGNKISTFYHDNNTGNLTKFQDGMGNTWQYVWANNNLQQTQDAKGLTTYEYDSWGNVKTQTTTVDSNPGNNIIKTMTYDDYNQLLEVIDGSGRKTSYKYSNKGELLSTSNPDMKESNGRKYDQNGNTIEYSPGVLGSQNMVVNGSMEIAGTGGNLLANWTRNPGAAAASLEGFRSHGNSALKISSSTVTTDTFYQSVVAPSASPLSKLTLRVDVKLDNVQPSGSTGGAIIKLDDGLGNWSAWYCWGTGTVPVTLTCQATRDNVVNVFIGLSSASGTAWFDGVQLVNSLNSDGFVLGAFNSVENGGFEQGLNNWGYTGATPTYSGEMPWEGLTSLSLNLPSAGTASIYQDVPVYGGESLTFTGMVKTNLVSGNGAYFKIDYYDASNNLITGATVQTGYVTGTQDWARLSTLASAPANAHHARVQGFMDGSGTVNFDAVKLIPRNSRRYTYDSAGNYVNTSEDASGKQNKATYDQNTGNQLTSTDALNYTTIYGYDNLNRLFQVTDPLIKNSYYNYDSVSNLVYSRDPRSASSVDNTYRSFYGPDKLNRLTNLTDPLNRNATYIYDRSGNLIQVLLPNGLQQDFAYDAANRLMKTTLDGGKYFTYAYDGANELTGVTDQDNSSYSWSYDGAHRLKSSTDTASYTLNYGWDKSNNLVSLSGNNYGIGYTYGSDNQLLYVNLPDSSYIFYDYDENGRVFNVRYPGSNNYRKIYYAPNGWVTQIQDPSVPGHYHYNYGYFDNGTISYNGSWAGGDYFNYDANGRLTYWYYSPMGGGSSTQENYVYDEAGNLLTKGSRTFTYNSANQITNAGYTYDANGNMTSDGTKIYVYNALNQLTQVKRASDNAVIATYTYNHNGLRRSKTVNGVTTTYNWDASGNLIRETTFGSSTYFYWVGGKLVGLKKNNTTYIVHDNLRGDVESITDTGGTIVAQAHYDPWGNQITASGTLVQPFRYAGYYYDDETGLYYLKSRYYSPALGRFLTRDGIGFIQHSNPQTLNLYSYCRNNPVSLIDPSGNAPQKLRDLVEHVGGTISWNAKTGIATVTVGGITKRYDIDNCKVVGGRIIVDDAKFYNDIGYTAARAGAVDAGSFAVDSTIETFGKKSPVGTVLSGVLTGMDVSETWDNSNYSFGQKVAKTAIQVGGGAIDVVGGTVIGAVAVGGVPETGGASLLVGAGGLYILGATVNTGQNWLYGKLGL